METQLDIFGNDIPVEVVTPHEDLIERPSEFLIKKVDKCLLIEYFKKIPAWVEAES